MTSLNSMAMPAKKHCGAIVLVTVVLMLVMVTLVTLYTGKIQSFEHKIMLNSQNHKLAFAAAESGIMRGLAELQQHKDWPGATINQVLMGQGRFTVSALKQNVIRDSHEVALFQLTAIGVSADGLATSTVMQQAIVYPLVVQTPKAPVVIAGAISSQASFELAANPNGGGEGIPLSIWSSGDVDMHAITGFTCGLEELSYGGCSASPYSSPMSLGSDILSQDTNFPDDIFAYLFNVSFYHNSALRSEAKTVLHDCLTLNQGSSGIVWVDGDCNVAAGLIIGSSAQPLLLLVNDGNLRLGDDTNFYGLVLMLKQVSTIQTFDVFIPATAAVHGALVANYSLGELVGNLRVIYDKMALQTLAESSDFLRVAKVPGSWHDI